MASQDNNEKECVKPSYNVKIADVGLEHSSSLLMKVGQMSMNKRQKHGTEGLVNRMSVSKCDFCRFRHSWDCDDGSSYPENGCWDFVLDKSTLSDEEQRMLVLFEILRGEQVER